MPGATELYAHDGDRSRLPVRWLTDEVGRHEQRSVHRSHPALHHARPTVTTTAAIVYRVSLGSLRPEYLCRWLLNPGSAASLASTRRCKRLSRAGYLLPRYPPSTRLDVPVPLKPPIQQRLVLEPVTPLLVCISPAYLYLSHGAAFTQRHVPVPCFPRSGGYPR